MKNSFTKLVVVNEVLDMDLLVKAMKAGLRVGLDLHGEWSESVDHVVIPKSVKFAVCEPISGVEKSDTFTVSKDVFASKNKEQMISAVTAIRALWTDELKHKYIFVSKVVSKGMMSDISYKETKFDSNGDAILEDGEQIVGCWYGIHRSTLLEMPVYDINKYHDCFRYYVSVMDSNGLVEVDQLGIDENKVNERLAMMIDDYINSKKVA